jgi:hypothetical protein
MEFCEAICLERRSDVPRRTVCCSTVYKSFSEDIKLAELGISAQTRFCSSESYSPSTATREAAESTITHSHSLYVLISIYPFKCYSYITFTYVFIYCLFLIPIYYVKIFLLCNAIATFSHRDSAAYFVAAELAPF